MPTSRVMAALALLLLAVAGRAAAPPCGNAGVAPYLPLYLGDSRLAQELKVAPDKARALEALTLPAMRQLRRAQLGGTWREAVAAEQSAALAKVLDAGQRARLRQVVLAQLETTPGGPEALLSDPEAAAALALSDDQRRRFLAGERLAALLTDAQKAAWRGLTGAPLASGRLFVYRVQDAMSWESGYGDLNLLRSADLILLLKLTPEQVDALDDLAVRTFDASAFLPFKEQQAADKAADARARELLTPAQRARLDQYIRWSELGLRSDLCIVEHPRLGPEVGATAEQKKKAQALRAEAVAAFIRLATSGARAGDVAKKSDELLVGLRRDRDALLTAEQKTRLDGLLGDKPKLQPFGMFPSRPRAGEAPDLSRKFLAIAVLRSARNPATLQAAGLDAGQIEKLAALDKATAPLPTDDTPETEAKRREQAAAVEKALAGFVPPAQLSRWKELVLQQFGTPDRPAAFWASNELFNVDEFIRGVGATDWQRRLSKRGAAPTQVLSAEQLAKWRTLLGKVPPPEPVPSPADAGRAALRYSGQPMLPQRDLTVEQLKLLGNFSGQQILKLTDAQKKDLRALADKARPGYPPAPPGFYTQQQLEAWQAAAVKHAREVLTGAAKVLDEGQRKRLLGIALWSLAYQGMVRNSVAALPEVAEQLKLKPDQVEAIGTAEADWKEIINVTQRWQPHGVNANQLWLDLRKATEERVEKALTEGQRAALKELLGSEVRFGFIMPGPDGFLPPWPGAVAPKK